MLRCDVNCVKVMSGLWIQSTRVVPRDLSVSYLKIRGGFFYLSILQGGNE